MAIQYPVLHMGCTPNPAFTIIPQSNPNILIDGNAVITSFTWKSNSDPSSTGQIMGNSTSMFADNQPVVIMDAAVTPYYTNPSPTVLSD